MNGGNNNQIVAHRSELVNQIDKKPRTSRYNNRSGWCWCGPSKIFWTLGWNICPVLLLLLLVTINCYYPVCKTENNWVRIAREELLREWCRLFAIESREMVDDDDGWKHARMSKIEPFPHERRTAGVSNFPKIKNHVRKINRPLNKGVQHRISIVKARLKRSDKVDDSCVRMTARRTACTFSLKCNIPFHT
jgi:hypothetical protein